MLTLIYLRNALLLSKRNYSGWREIQDQFFDYKTSLSPYTVEELFEFLDDDCPEGPFVREQVTAFLASDAEIMSGRADRDALVGPGWPEPPTTRAP